MNCIIDDITKFIGDIFYDIIYDKNRFTMTLIELSMTSNIGYLGTKIRVISLTLLHQAEPPVIFRAYPR